MTQRMIADDDYEDLPADPEAAFMRLEKKYRSELAAAVEQHESNDDMHYLAYINQTHAASLALGLAIFKDWRLPHHRSNLYDAYREFSVELEHFLVQIRVHRGRRSSGFSVALDTPTKMKLQHHITQIRETVLKLSVTPRKKEALIVRLTAFSEEVDRDRTRFDAFAALTLEVATTTGEVAKKAKPAVDAVAKLLGFAKEAEDARPALAPPEQRRQIEAPRRDRPPEPSSDDEPPF